jgi:hypothetical protein
MTGHGLHVTHHRKAWMSAHYTGLVKKATFFGRFCARLQPLGGLMSPDARRRLTEAIAQDGSRPFELPNPAELQTRNPKPEVSGTAYPRRLPSTVVQH